MVRAAKKQRNTDSSAFEEAVAASSKLDGTGVTIEGGGPVYTVALSEEEHRSVGDELTKTLREIERVKAVKKKTAKDFRDDIAILEARRDTLRDEWDSGKRKIDPPVVTDQGSLPGLEGASA